MLPTLAKQTPDGHSWRVMCASTSSRKCFSTEAIGAGTTCPSPQIDVARSAWVSSSIKSSPADDQLIEVLTDALRTTLIYLPQPATQLRPHPVRQNCTALSAIRS